MDCKSWLCPQGRATKGGNSPFFGAARMVFFDLPDLTTQAKNGNLAFVNRTDVLFWIANGAEGMGKPAVSTLVAEVGVWKRKGGTARRGMGRRSHHSCRGNRPGGGARRHLRTVLTMIFSFLDGGMGRPAPGRQGKEKPEPAVEQRFPDLVEEDGFEPSKAKPADLQSVPFGHLGTPPYEIGDGKWSWWTDSNPRPADYKSAALPAELHQHTAPFPFAAKVIIPGGVEFVNTFLVLHGKNQQPRGRGGGKEDGRDDPL